MTISTWHAKLIEVFEGRVENTAQYFDDSEIESILLWLGRFPSADDTLTQHLIELVNSRVRAQRSLLIIVDKILFQEPVAYPVLFGRYPQSDNIHDKLRRRYQLLVRIFHPDRQMTDEAWGTTRMELINSAYKMALRLPPQTFQINDPVRHRNYYNRYHENVTTSIGLSITDFLYNLQLRASRIYDQTPRNFSKLIFFIVIGLFGAYVMIVSFGIIQTNNRIEARISHDFVNGMDSRFIGEIGVQKIKKTIPVNHEISDSGKTIKKENKLLQNSTDSKQPIDYPVPPEISRKSDRHKERSNNYYIEINKTDKDPFVGPNLPYTPKENILAYNANNSKPVDRKLAAPRIDFQDNSDKTIVSLDTAGEKENKNEIKMHFTRVDVIKSVFNNPEKRERNVTSLPLNTEEKAGEISHIKGKQIQNRVLEKPQFQHQRNDIFSLGKDSWVVQTMSFYSRLQAERFVKNNQYAKYYVPVKEIGRIKFVIISGDSLTLDGAIILSKKLNKINFGNPKVRQVEILRNNIVNI